MKINHRIVEWLVKHIPGTVAGGSEAYYREKLDQAVHAGTVTLEQVKQWHDEQGDEQEKSNETAINRIADKVAEKLTGAGAGQGKTMNKAFNSGSPDPAAVFGGSIRVKTGSEAYCTTKSVGRHIRTGLPVLNEQGREVQTSSQQERAFIGAWFKMLAARCGVGVHLTEHDKSLVNEILEKHTFCGLWEGRHETGIPGAMMKALLNDSTSGGVHATPEFFDDLLLTYPLLHSELLPMVTIRPVPRGKTVEGASVGNPTVQWGTAEGTAVGLLDTDDLLGEIEASIHPVTCAVEIGLDFMADSAPDVGGTIEDNIGQRMLAELDRCIAIGSGVGEPLGIFNASGLTAATAANGNAGPPTVADYEGLLFAVGKQYRNAAMRCAFLASDTTYARARGIPVDSSSDERRVFGMDHQSYTLLQYPFRVQNDVPNTKIAFGAMSRYRLYRRQGAETRWETGGSDLARRNMALLIVRGRFGSAVPDGSAFAVITNAKT